jgi:glycosyltransferase involved in cell wall biosynthesis
MPKVSVIIPAYNRANYIAESIQSVLDQTFADFEIVVVDDGSTDNTREVIESFHDPRIRHFHQENRGPAAAANRAMELSRGEYISLFSSDDDLLPTALEKGVQVLDAHPEVAFSYGQTYLMDERGRVFDLPKKPKYSYIREGMEEIKGLLTRGDYIPTPTVMVRRSYLFEVGLYDPTFRYGSEDFDLWVRLAKKYKVAYIAEPLIKYRVHSSSLTGGRKLDEVEKSNSLIFEGIFNDAHLGIFFSAQRPKAYFHLYSTLALSAYGRREMKTARRYLFKALKIHPQGLFQSTGLLWIYHFIKVWIPLPVLRAARRVKHFLYKVVLMSHNINNHREANG